MAIATFQKEELGDLCEKVYRAAVPDKLKKKIALTVTDNPSCARIDIQIRGRWLHPLDRLLSPGEITESMSFPLARILSPSKEDFTKDLTNFIRFFISKCGGD